MPFLLLGLSVVLSTGRNLLSKNLSNVRFRTRPFFWCQSALFLCGAVALVLFGKISSGVVAYQTLIYAAVYAILLIFAQWFYTAALAKGNTALCSTVYSLGFILPTLSGAILWAESFSFLDLLGIMCAVSAVIVSGLKSQAKEKATKSYYFIPLVIAMLASGGLGIVQKLQQKSAYAEQKSIFLLIAFTLAAVISLIFSLFAKKQGDPPFRRGKLAVASCIGVCFGCCNLLNTTLAGLLDSAIFFPTLNIGVILLSMICGVIFFKERITKKEITVLILGGVSILLLNFG
jgi:drug/metabolite transporter (DMT)-like permease